MVGLLASLYNLQLGGALARQPACLVMTISKLCKLFIIMCPKFIVCISWKHRSWQLSCMQTYIFDVDDLKVSHHRYYIQRMSLIVMAMTQGHIFTLLIL